MPAEGLGKFWVFQHDTSTDALGACIGTLVLSGLRREIVAWTDVLLSSWGTIYYGHLILRFYRTVPWAP
jgi:hypothetical protein